MSRGRRKMNGSKRKVSSITIISVGVILSLLWFAYTKIFPLWDSDVGSFLYGMKSREFVLAYIPIGAIFATLCGNRKHGLWVASIMGLICIPVGLFAQAILAFMATIFVSMIWKMNKFPKVLRVVIISLCLAVFSVFVAYMDGANINILGSLVRISIAAVLSTVMVVVVCVFIRKISFFEASRQKQEELDSNFRKHSIEEKIMHILNVTCILILLVTCTYAVFVLSDELEKTNKNSDSTIGRLFEIVLQEDKSAFYTESEKEKKDLGEKLANEMDGYDIALPAIVQVRSDYTGDSIRLTNYKVEKQENIEGWYSVSYVESYIETDAEVIGTFFSIPDDGEIEVVFRSGTEFVAQAPYIIKKTVALSFVIMALMNLIAEAYIRKYIVKPINEMTTVAMNFTYHTEENRKQARDSFKELKIDSGDEIESLYNVLDQSMTDMTNYMDYIKEKTDQITNMQHSVITTMADIIESRDENTGGHIKRTAIYVEIIAKKLKEDGMFADILTDDYIEDMIVAAPLHDMGKIHVPDGILNKNGRLTDEEFEIMKSHTSSGKQLLGKASNQMGEFDYLDIAIDMAESHHEWWNGRGYPSHLEGEDIPLCARIMAVADVFDALVSKRCYKAPMEFEKACSIIEEETGTHFDPVVAKAFLDSLDEVKRVAAELADE